MTNPFDDDTKQNDQTDPKPEDLLAQIKNDDGNPKYANVEAALKALKESQEFIPKVLQEKKTVEQELAEARQKLEKAKTLEELTEALKSKQQPTDPQQTKEGEPKGVAPEDIDKLLENKLAAREQASKQKQNLETVINTVSSKYGDKAKEHIQKVADQLGTTPSKLQELAAENPNMALRLLDAQGSSSPNPSVSTTSAPRTIQDDNPMPTFEKSAARGGLSNDELVARWRQVKDYTHKKLGVSES